MLCFSVEGSTVHDCTKADYWSWECPYQFLGFEADTPHPDKYFNSLVAGVTELNKVERQKQQERKETKQKEDDNDDNDDDDDDDDNDSNSDDMEGPTDAEGWSGFLQLILGSCMTGRVSNKSFYVIYGPSADNGKSTVFLKFLKKIFGIFCTTALKMVVFQNKKHPLDMSSTHTLHLLCYQNPARMTVCNEASKNYNINDTVVKTVSGGDLFQYHGLNAKDKAQFEFVSKAKLFILTQHHIQWGLHRCQCGKQTGGHSISESVCEECSQPGDVAIDTQFLDDLENKHMDEMLTWIAKGAKKWYDNKCRKPTPPPLVAKYTAEAVKSNSIPLIHFMNKYYDDTKVISTTAVYNAFKKATGSEMSNTLFGILMDKLGYKKEKSGMMKYCSLQLRPDKNSSKK